MAAAKRHFQPNPHSQDIDTICRRNNNGTEIICEAFQISNLVSLSQSRDGKDLILDKWRLLFDFEHDATSSPFASLGVFGGVEQ